MALENVRKAEALQAELDQLRPLDREQEARIMQKFRLDWNYHSNHLEGNSLTFGETKALILHHITAQGKPLKDHIEITGHDEAIKWIEDVVKEHSPLTEKFIRELHELLLKKPYEVDAVTPDGKPTKRMITVGKYKTSPNHVKTKTGEIFYFATPEETPAKMHDLINWFREQKEANTNPILLSAEFHYKFIRIHPFDDGNGRTARILMNFILMQAGYPPVIIKTEDKEIYFSVLQQADADILEPFVEFIAGNLIHSLEIMLKGAKGGNIDEDDDIDKELFLLEQKLNAIETKVRLVKDYETVITVFQNSITPLIDLLILNCHKFDSFYLKHYFDITFNEEGMKNLSFFPQDELHNLPEKITDKTERISFAYHYRVFSRSKFAEFDYITTIAFQFQMTNYTIFGSGNKLLLTKRYDEQLTEIEIKEIIKDEVKEHKEYIEKQMQNQSKK